MKKKLISYKIAISYISGRNMVVYNVFESIIDIIKNYAQYKSVKNIKVSVDNFHTLHRKANFYTPQ